MPHTLAMGPEPRQEPPSPGSSNPITLLTGCQRRFTHTTSFKPAKRLQGPEEPGLQKRKPVNQGRLPWLGVEGCTQNPGHTGPEQMGAAEARERGSPEVHRKQERRLEAE